MVNWLPLGLWSYHHHHHCITLREEYEIDAGNPGTQDKSRFDEMVQLLGWKPVKWHGLASRQRYSLSKSVFMWEGWPHQNFTIERGIKESTHFCPPFTQMSSGSLTRRERRLWFWALLDQQCHSVRKSKWWHTTCPWTFWPVMTPPRSLTPSRPSSTTCVLPSPVH